MPDDPVPPNTSPLNAPLTRVMSATDRLENAMVSIDDYKACVRSIFIDGMKFAIENILVDENIGPGSDPTGCYEYFLRSINATFEYGDSDDERRHECYAISILFYAEEIRDTLLKLMVDRAVVDELNAQLGDPNGLCADLSSKIRMKAREFVASWVELVDRVHADESLKEESTISSDHQN